MLKKLGIPIFALAAMLFAFAPSPAKAGVHFGISVGPPVYTAPYPYSYNTYPTYPYGYYGNAYPYGYSYAPYYYGGSGWGHWHGHDRDDWGHGWGHEWHGGHEFHGGHEHGEFHGHGHRR